MRRGRGGRGDRGRWANRRRGGCRGYRCRRGRWRGWSRGMAMRPRPGTRRGVTGVGEAPGLVAEGIGLDADLAPHGLDLGSLLGEHAGEVLVLAAEVAEGVQLGAVGTRLLG